MSLLSRRPRRTLDIWPGFVDALATLLMVIIFLLLVFVIGQVILGAQLSGRDVALQRLNQQIAELADLLSLERRANADLRDNVAQLTVELQAAATTRDQYADLLAQRDALAAQLAESSERLTAAQQVAKELEDAYKIISADKETIDKQLGELAALRNEIVTLRALRTELEKEIDRMGGQVREGETRLAEERKLSETARAQVALLNQQINALREQLQRIQAALEIAEKEGKEKDVQIADLGRRLNLALASKVEELSRYRSEFFGRLREVLGNRSDIRVVGDRFVFQSEVLFPSGSAELNAEGQVQLQRLAGALKEITKSIPKDLNWVLRVDGHTDRVPINTAQFPTNWELSTARAIAVVKHLVAQGIPPDRLAATGFGEYQPLDPGLDESALRRNRRIEFKLTER